MKGVLFAVLGLLLVSFAFAANETNETNQTETVNESMNVTVNMTDTNTTNTTTTNETNTTVVTSTGATVNLYIKEWYPKNNHFVFVCDEDGFVADRFTWYYGDGHKLIDIQNRDTYHIYEQTGVYTVNCTASNGATSASDSMTINVLQSGLPTETFVNGTGNNSNTTTNTTNSAALCAEATVSVTNTNGRDVSVSCSESADFTPTNYVWNFGDGNVVVGNAASTHTYASDGTYTVSCVATDGDSVAMGNSGVSISTTTTTTNETNTTTTTNTTNETNTATFDATLVAVDGVTTNATGSVTATVDEDDDMTLTGSFSDLGSDVLAAYIFEGNDDNPADAVFTLNVDADSNNRDGTLSFDTTLTDSQRDTLEAGDYEVAILTIDNSNGEIRGELS
jgi:hypothetical protein